MSQPNPLTLSVLADKDSAASASGTGPAPQGAEPAAQSQAKPLVPDAITFHLATDDELHETCSRKWAVSGPFNIDQWPPEVQALSIPTKFIPVTDFDEWWQIWEGDAAVGEKYAALIDAETGWREYFIRLNSRSPKDAAAPGLPITCAGKQAIYWIGASVRCADDTSLHQHARKPLFICLRERRWIMPEWEFRCFAKGGKLIAVSRYDYHNPAAMGEGYAAKAWSAADRFYSEHLAAHYDDVVFDLHSPGNENELLIELNPYGLSDPCLFRTYDEVEKGGVRISDSDGNPEGGAGTAPSRSDDSAGRKVSPETDRPHITEGD